MKLVNFISSQRSPLRNIFVRESIADGAQLWTGNTTQASKTFYDPDTKTAAFTVYVNPSYMRGRRSNFINVGIYLQTGVRYFATCYGDDESKNNGTVSTAGGAGGYGATETGAIVSKINSSALNTYIKAVLHNNFTNKVYVAGATGVTFSDAVPLGGGRG